MGGKPNLLRLFPPHPHRSRLVDSRHLRGARIDVTRSENRAHLSRDLCSNRVCGIDSSRKRRKAGTAGMFAFAILGCFVGTVLSFT